MTWRKRFPRLYWLATRLGVVVPIVGAISFRQWSLHDQRQRDEVAALQLDRQLGVTAETLDRGTAVHLRLPPVTQGVVVTSLSEKGPAARAGMQTGDVIERIDTFPVQDTQSAAKALREDKVPHSRLSLNRHGTHLTIAVDRGPTAMARVHLLREVQEAER